MKNKTLSALLLGLTAVLLVVCSFGGGFVAGHFLKPNNQPTITADSSSDLGGTPEELTRLFAPFWEAWKIVHQEYVDQPVDDTRMMEGAISGMMQSLGDEHSTYMNPEEFESATTQLAGSYAGIGAYVDTNGELLTITKPMPDSPAEKKGLQPGDQVVAIDGEDVRGLVAEAVRQMVLGPEGTTVKLTILRPGQETPFDVEIVRAIIVVPSVTSKMLPGGIAYIQLTTFGDNTAGDLHEQLQQLISQKPSGLILDLRNNGGGYLETAVSVASEFIANGVVVVEKYGDGTEIPHKAIRHGLATNPSLPMIVLVNGYSASASEVVAGALQDAGRAKLLGEVTYGKGTVQNWVPLSDSEGAVRVTIARWLTPSGRTIDKQGLTPDVIVELTNADFEANKDPQLDEAVKQLTNP